MESIKLLWTFFMACVIQKYMAIYVCICTHMCVCVWVWETFFWCYNLWWQKNTFFAFIIRGRVNFFEIEQYISVQLIAGSLWVSLKEKNKKNLRIDDNKMENDFLIYMPNYLLSNFYSSTINPEQASSSDRIRLRADYANVSANVIRRIKHGDYGQYNV